MLRLVNGRFLDLIAELVICLAAMDTTRYLALLNAVAGLTQHWLEQTVRIAVAAIRLALPKAIISAVVVGPDAARSSVSEAIA